MRVFPCYLYPTLQTAAIIVVYVGHTKRLIDHGKTGQRSTVSAIAH